MKLIDADWLKCEMQILVSNLEDMAESMGGQGLLCKRLNTLAEGVQRGIDMLNEQPTIEERKTAKWAWVEEESGTVWTTGEPIFDAHFQCSECGFRPFENLEGDEVLTKYCPHCGAKMENADEKEEEQ